MDEKMCAGVFVRTPRMGGLCQFNHPGIAELWYADDRADGSCS